MHGCASGKQYCHNSPRRLNGFEDIRTSAKVSSERDRIELKIYLNHAYITF